MPDAEADGPESIDDLDVIVDADVHLTERQEDFFPYLDDPFDGLFGRKAEDDYGLYDTVYPKSGFVTPVMTGAAQSDPVRERADVLAGMDEMGTDMAIISPTMNLYLAMVQYDELAVALASAYNDWLLDEFLDPSAGLYGGALVAPHRPDRAAEEIDDRAGEPGVVAVIIPSGGVSPPLGNRRYHPIYEAAVDNDLPVLLHGAAASLMMSFPLQFQGFSRYLETHVTAHPMQHMTHLTSIITQGIPVRFPDLTVVMQEAGIGWIPYITRRLDHEYSAKTEDAPMLEKLPSEYIREQFYFTSQPVEGLDEPEYVRSTIRNMNGAESLMFSSDFPHLDFDYTGELLSAIDGMGREAAENIYGRTALEVFPF